MIEGIVIANEASFGPEPQELAGLKRTNFIYGSNGSGKTTISRVVEGLTEFPGCDLTWADGRQLERLVYNREFVERTYHSRMAGIFTLGTESEDTLNDIAEARRKLGELDADITNRKVTLSGIDGQGGKLKDQRDIRARLEEDCWVIKGRHDPHFQDAFTGFRGAKPTFCDKVLQERTSNQSELHDIETLKTRVQTVFEKGLVTQPLIDVISGERLANLETHPILSKKIIGKDDVDVAALIQKLKNSDWVRQGMEYLPHSEGSCPFCQQGLPHDIEAQLGQYFDETYTQDIAAVDQVVADYEAEYTSVAGKLTELMAAEFRYLDASAVGNIKDRLGDRCAANLRALDTKKKEPSAIVSLEPTQPILADVDALIAKANAETEEQNRLLQNLITEKETVKSQVWRLIVEEAGDAIGRFANDNRDVDAAIAGLRGGIDQKTAERAEIAEELRRLERSITSVEPTVTEINGLLASFGFSGFRLKTAGEGEGQYEIVRPNGADATPTLSEGERTFVTFLYFYHLLRGSASESGITTERVVVIDDPVSSLDSDILFIVSSLIKRLLKEAIAGTGQIKQVIVLTHNIYFHKEVTFDAKRPLNGCRAHETFWVVKKRDEASIVTNHDQNPVRTSYELLWAEVKNPQRSNLTIQNTLRRIIENYFTILGNIDRETIIDLFDGQEKMICGALFSWINDGSHFASDDLYLASDEVTVEKFLQVFRKVFEKSGHPEHYRMMMGEGYSEATPDPANDDPVAPSSSIGETLVEGDGSGSAELSA